MTWLGWTRVRRRNAHQRVVMELAAVAAEEIAARIRPTPFDANPHITRGYVLALASHALVRSHWEARFPGPMDSKERARLTELARQRAAELVLRWGVTPLSGARRAA